MTRYMLCCEDSSLAAMTSDVVYYLFKERCSSIYRLGAILATDGIKEPLVIRTSTEAEALDLWRKELVAGNRIAPVGTIPAQEARYKTSVQSHQSDLCYSA